MVSFPQWQKAIIDSITIRMIFSGTELINVIQFDGEAHRSQMAQRTNAFSSWGRDSREGGSLDCGCSADPRGDGCSSALGRLTPINYAGHACLIIRVVLGYDAFSSN
jgi:hypothetical protein